MLQGCVGARDGLDTLDRATRRNALRRNAPHPARVVLADEWTHPYTREVAAYPASWVKEHKFWPYVARIDNVYGDRHLVCACLPLEEYA